MVKLAILFFESHSNARIINMHVEKINKYLDEKYSNYSRFQGVSKNGDIIRSEEGLRCYSCSCCKNI